MAVLADAGETDIDPAPADQPVQALGLGGGLGQPVDRHEADRPAERADEALFQIAPEARRMVRAETDIFVEMESGDLRPVDVVGRDERLQHLELAGASGDDDRRLAEAGQSLADGRCPALCRLCAESLLVRYDPQIDHGNFEPFTR